MHELGIVTYVAKAVNDIACQRKLTEVQYVTLEIGEVSGIVPEYLADCWEYFKKQYQVLKNSKLQYEILEAVTYCEVCKEEYATVQYGIKCPYCGSEKTYLLTGNECMIKEIGLI